MFAPPTAIYTHATALRNSKTTQAIILQYAQQQKQDFSS